VKASNSCARILIFGSFSFIVFLSVFSFYSHLFCLSVLLPFPMFFCFFITLLFHPCFVFVFRLMWISSLTYLNLLGTKRLGCYCCCISGVASSMLVLQMFFIVATCHVTVTQYLIYLVFWRIRF
jgi:hypothetical protein